MAVKGNEDICRIVSDLIQLDFDAIDAYRAAIDRLAAERYRDRLGEFLADHERHVRELSVKVRELGGQPPGEADFMRYLTKGSVVIASLMEDRGILQAMSANAQITNRAYQSALDALAGTADIERLVRRNRDDERRHTLWLDTTLDSDMQSAA